MAPQILCCSGLDFFRLCFELAPCGFHLGVEIFVEVLLCVSCLFKQHLYYLYVHLCFVNLLVKFFMNVLCPLVD
jgi:hypothetical protein